MDTPRNFRSAFNGFNRQDVVQYLEYLNAKHTNQINQLNAEIDQLRSQAAPAPEADCQLELKALQTKCDVLTAQLEAANAELQACSEAPVPMSAPVVPEEPAAPVVPVSSASELEFYRRAEQAERDARDRADLTYFQVNNVLSEATAKVEGISAEITNMADDVMSQLTQLQMAISGSKHALQDAAAIMNTIRPNK